MEITLSSRKYPGLKAIIDEEDYSLIEGHKWHPMKSPTKGRDLFYAVTDVYREGVRTTLTMHRLVLDAKKGSIIDHINGNGLDNRKSNLRAVTQRENLHNQHFKYASKYPGVVLNKSDKKWRAYLTNNKLGKKRHVHLGVFDTEEEAYHAYLWGVGEVEAGREIPSIREMKKTSRFKNVNWKKNVGKWVAELTVKGKYHYLGCFDSEMDAHGAVVKFREQNGSD